MAGKRKSFRWKCPECEIGINAPATLDALDPRRFCLDCSAEEGRKKMVERVCLRKEKERAKKKAKAKRKAKRKTFTRLQHDAEQYVYGGVHLRKEMFRISKLRIFKGKFKGNSPEIVLRYTNTPNYLDCNIDQQFRTMGFTIGSKVAVEEILVRMVWLLLLLAFRPRESRLLELMQEAYKSIYKIEVPWVPFHEMLDQAQLFLAEKRKNA